MHSVTWCWNVPSLLEVHHMQINLVEVLGFLSCCRWSLKCIPSCRLEFKGVQRSMHCGHSLSLPWSKPGNHDHVCVLAWSLRDLTKLLLYSWLQTVYVNTDKLFVWFQIYFPFSDIAYSPVSLCFLSIWFCVVCCSASISVSLLPWPFFSPRHVSPPLPLNPPNRASRTHKPKLNLAPSAHYHFACNYCWRQFVCRWLLQAKPNIPTVVNS